MMRRLIKSSNNTTEMAFNLFVVSMWSSSRLQDLVSLFYLKPFSAVS